MKLQEYFFYAQRKQNYDFIQQFILFCIRLWWMFTTASLLTLYWQVLWMFLSDSQKQANDSDDIVNKH